ncbi:MAG TPA: DUF2442 domain-containing protein [Candidatus Bathyarchaeia archaeon]|nr:DUF2442 domain-containing protein [Candidatus Bathyarchaeia archaeon]
MRISTAKTEVARAREVWFESGMLHVRLVDGRIISVPLDWFPRLKNARPEQQGHWRLTGGGIGVHWPDLDEDVSVAALLN